MKDRLVGTGSPLYFFSMTHEKTGLAEVSCLVPGFCVLGFEFVLWL